MFCHIQLKLQDDIIESVLHASECGVNGNFGKICYCCKTGWQLLFLLVNVLMSFPASIDGFSLSLLSWGKSEMLSSC